MDKIITVKDLRKSYGEVKAVNGLDFYVERGKMFAFLGPNGAGKSTTIDMICTFLRPDDGTVIVDGHTLGKDDNAIRSVIGAVFQEGMLDRLLTIEENLRVRGGFYGLHGRELTRAVERTAHLAGVEELLRRPYGKLSGGQRRRCDIARALINTPKILFLDEPTTGLDPQTRKSIWETVREIQRKSGMTVFLTTHYMEEAAVCDYVIVIDGGRIVAKGTPAELKEEYSSDRLRLTCENMEKVADILRQRGAEYTQTGDTLEVLLPSTIASLPLLLACKDHISGFEVLRGTMDDAFIAITGRELRE